MYCTTLVFPLNSIFFDIFFRVYSVCACLGFLLEYNVESLFEKQLERLSP